MLLNSLLEATWYPVLFDSPMNTARGVAFWLTIALVIAFVAAMLLTKEDARKKCAKISLIVAVVYACVLAIAFLSLTFAEDGIEAILFVPLLVLVIAVAAGAVVLSFRRTRAVIWSVACIAGAALIAVLVCMGVYYGSGTAEDNNGVAITVSENVALYLCTAALIAVLAAVALFFGRKDKKGFDAKTISYAAVCIAMSFALSYIRIVKLPQGGSVTIASLLPLMIYSYMFGVRKGIFAGFIYGLLQAIQDPWIIHPAQFLLDYPVAFACIGVAGLFAKTEKLAKLPQLQFAFGAVLASILRFASHIFSGVFAFSEYAYDAAGNVMNPWLYSIAYNSFVFADIAIVIVVGVIVFSSSSFVKQARKFNFKQEEKPAVSE